MSEPPEDPFVRAVRRQAEQTRRQRTLSFWDGLSLVGAVGWMVSLPSVGGAFLGRWLDRHYGTGVFWTLTLLLIGVVLGSATSWRHVRKVLGP